MVQLNTEWNIWYHLPTEQKWDIDSYHSLCKFNTVESCVAITKEINESFITNCMFFLMRNNIKPIWEDEENINGGCFSLKIQNRHVSKTWNKLIYSIVGETLFDDESIMSNVNGLTISPKKYFCIIKIWMKTCDVSDINLLNKNINVNYESCMFKKHKE